MPFNSSSFGEKLDSVVGLLHLLASYDKRAWFRSLRNDETRGKASLRQAVTVELEHSLEPPPFPGLVRVPPSPTIIIMPLSTALPFVPALGTPRLI